ncbi:MAG TPA: hypothetical protein VIJ12_01000 [Candidatus Baltobacteraceae bacterium]
MANQRGDACRIHVNARDRSRHQPDAPREVAVAEQVRERRMHDAGMRDDRYPLVSADELVEKTADPRPHQVKGLAVRRPVLARFQEAASCRRRERRDDLVPCQAFPPAKRELA